MVDFRCRKCNKLLARYSQCQELEIKCSRCGLPNAIRPCNNQVRCAVVSNQQDNTPLPALCLSNLIIPWDK